MTIDRLALRNFLMFTGEQEFYYKNGDFPDGQAVSFGNSFDTEFIKGINVFIGSNATGKSTLLKCIYAACEFSNRKTSPNKAKHLKDYFSSSKKPIKEINQKRNDGNYGLLQVYSGDNKFHYRTWDNGTIDIESWFELGIKSILIPTTEMLSHSEGLVAMASKYGIPFDHTQIDILVNAQLWETNEISKGSMELLETISTIIDGEVIYEEDTFYVQKRNGLKVEFSLEAEGFRKFGLLWKLIRNGLLESGTILLWDEPEASINPELMPLLVNILYRLKNNGIQIFLATHSYMLAKYLDVLKCNDNDVLFISLYKNTEDKIDITKSAEYSTLSRNPIEASEEKLYYDIVEKSMEALK